MGKFSEFKLPLKSLSQGHHEFSYRLGKSFFVNMESADIRDADLLVALSVDYRGDVYDLSFDISGNLTLQCDRCLDDLVLPIQTAYHIMVKYGDAYRDDSDELLEIPFSEPDLNVAYMIFDTVSLAIPIKHVHPLGKCNRQMSSILKKHHARPVDDDPDDTDALLDDIDDIEDLAQAPSDPRWDALKGLSSLSENPADNG